MVFISLGSACLVRQSIDIFNGFRGETNFFDWIMTNFTTVLFVFQHLNNPESFLTIEKFIDKGIISNNPNHRFIDHLQLNFSSLHDFPAEQSFLDYFKIFVDKYTRRMIRLKNLILNYKEGINYILYIPYCEFIPTIEQIFYFIINIREINPLCIFYIHLLIPPEINYEKEKIDKLEICNNVKIHYMISDGSIINIQRTDLNFKEVYEKISTL
jgi:hypothetical protein